MNARNQRTYDPATGNVTVVSPQGKVILQRPARTPEKALEEFRYAVRVWFSCMDRATRQDAVEYAMDHLADEFNPNVEPQ